MSLLVNGLGLAAQLKPLTIGQAFTVSLKQGVSFNRVMKSVTAICCRLDIKVEQRALKAVSTDARDTIVINVINVERVL